MFKFSSNVFRHIGPKFSLYKNNGFTSVPQTIFFTFLREITQTSKQIQTLFTIWTIKNTGISTRINNRQRVNKETNK